MASCIADREGVQARKPLNRTPLLDVRLIRTGKRARPPLFAARGATNPPCGIASTHKVVVGSLEAKAVAQRTNPPFLRNPPDASIPTAIQEGRDRANPLRVEYAAVTWDSQAVTSVYHGQSQPMNPSQVLVNCV